MKRSRLPTLFAIFTFILFSFIAMSTYAGLSIDDFLAEPDIYDAEFSPDGRYLALIMKDGNSRTLIIRDFEQEGYPITGTMKSGFIRPSSVTWANNERIVVNLLVPEKITEKSYLKRVKKDPSFSLDKYRMSHRSVAMDVNAKNQVLLFNDNYRLKMNRNLSSISNFLTKDKEHIIMPAWGSNSYDLYKVNVYTGEVALLTRGISRTYQYMTDVEGNPLYRLDYYYYRKSIIIHEFSDNEEWVEAVEVFLEDEEIEDRQYLFSLSDVNKLIYRKRNKDTGFYEIIERTSKMEDTRVIAALPNTDIHSAIIDSRTGNYLGYRTQIDRIENHYLDKDRQQTYDFIASNIPNSSFGAWASRETSKRVVIRASSTDNPGTYFIYNYQTKKLTFIGDIYNNLIPEKLATPALANYKARDGLSIRLYILLPPGYKAGKMAPMVIMPHGGPHARDYSTYDMFAQFVASLGNIVIQPNFRGSTGYGLKFEEAGYKQWGGTMQNDLTDAVNFMVEKGYVDAGRVCIVGGSYGGYAALMATVKTPDLFRCSISINGVSDLKAQIKHSRKIFDDEKGKDFIRRSMGDPDVDSDMLDVNSPYLHAKKIQTPILMIAGEFDRRVLPKQSKLMAESLEDEGKEFTFIKIKDAGHNIFEENEAARQVFQEVERFLSKYLADH